MTIIKFERKSRLSKEESKYKDALTLLSNKAQEEHYSKHNDTIAKLLLCLFWDKKFDISSLRILDEQYLKAALTVLSSFAFSMKNVESLLDETLLLVIAENHELNRKNIEM
jgi:hypothetical protein